MARRNIEIETTMTIAYGFDQPTTFFRNVIDKPLTREFKEPSTHIIREDEPTIIDENSSVTQDMRKETSSNKFVTLVDALEICNDWHQVIPSSNKMEKKRGIHADAYSSEMKINPAKFKSRWMLKKEKNAPKSVKTTSKKRKMPPILVSEGPADEKLPSGWTKKIFQRNSGVSKGHLDKYWYSPVTKTKFRSMAEIKRFLKFLRECQGDEEVALLALKKKL